LLSDIKRYGDLARKVYDQTFRRVIQGESVPAGQKVVSIFEEHTDIIVKDNRDTFCGHKICLTVGASNLILDCVVLDGGFASKDNLAKAKERKIKDVCFAKKRGLKETDMGRSEYVYKPLRRFRAGIEAGISYNSRTHLFLLYLNDCSKIQHCSKIWQH
jgi:IS5 family transposase